jgi:hypothetical protein
LVAISKIDSAPVRSLLDSLAGPGSVGQIKLDLLVEGFVTLERHSRRLLLISHFSSVLEAGCPNENLRDEKGPNLGLVAASK